ncbi:hypothetical protein RRG08_066113 [Elysia crispata]|uniref:Uncharacterized protein n=1 Tax=Elysia crispata TaxID=231223 RepID=A0AAE0ZCN2_9GAST|nr:hypothetical protein RRG08_066113 [Elysia crispata]
MRCVWTTSLDVAVVAYLLTIFLASTSSFVLEPDKGDGHQGRPGGEHGQSDQNHLTLTAEPNPNTPAGNTTHTTTRRDISQTTTPGGNDNVDSQTADSKFDKCYRDCYKDEDELNLSRCFGEMTSGKFQLIEKKAVKILHGSHLLQSNHLKTHCL